MSGYGRGRTILHMNKVGKICVVLQDVGGVNPGGFEVSYM
jgi:hypothetical protein